MYIQRFFLHSLSYQVLPIHNICVVWHQLMLIYLLLFGQDILRAVVEIICNTFAV